MDATSLRREAEKLRNEAASRRQTASTYSGHADQYSQGNDYTRAQVEQDQADRLTRDASGFEERALALEVQARDKENQAKRLDDEKMQLQQRIDTIEKEKDSLLGGGGLLSII